MINYDDRTSKILDKIQNLSFTDLIKTFNNIDSKNDIKISDYYKKNDNINDLFKDKTYKNEENSVLDITENASIPVTGNKIELENFKNSKQLGVLYFNYNNGSTSGLNLNSILSQYTINDYDIIKIIFSGNQIYSNNSSTGAININVGNFSNCMYLNLYLETFVTGCHGKPISGSRKNASGNNGGNGESSNNAGDGIVLNGSGSTNLRINIQKNSKLSGGFGGNGGAGGRAGRSKINQVDEQTETTYTLDSPPTVTEYNAQYTGGFNWDAKYGRLLNQGNIYISSDRKNYYIVNGTSRSPAGVWKSDPWVAEDNNRFKSVYESVGNPVLTNEYIFNGTGESDNITDRWYSDSEWQSHTVQVSVYNFKKTYWTKTENTEITVEYVAPQDAISAGDGSSGSFADSSHNSGNPFPSLYSSSSTRASNGDAVPTGSRQAGITGTGGAHGIDGLQIKNSATNITLSHY